MKKTEQTRFVDNLDGKPCKGSAMVGHKMIPGKGSSDRARFSARIQVERGKDSPTILIRCYKPSIMGTGDLFNYPAAVTVALPIATAVDLVKRLVDVLVVVPE